MSDSVHYVIHSKPQREAVAYANVVAQGFAAFLPLGKEADKPACPLFPSYLFVQVERDRNWAPLTNTRGVHRILSTPEGFPVPVPCAVMDELKSRLVLGTIPVKATTGRRRFISGDRVRIIDGPFQSLDALFVALRGERAEIVLDIAGRTAKVTVDARSLT